MTATVVIVGRPNVGKSTLFNRLIGRHEAIVDDTPGVTRDRREGRGRLAGRDFVVVDTAGLEEAFDDSLAARTRRQTERAVAGAAAVLMVVDARSGIVPLDEHFAQWLRRQNVPVILVANKAEGGGGAAGVGEAWRLGLGTPVPISAEHGEGALAPLLDAAEARAATSDDAVQADDGESEVVGPLRLAIVGRPNVGKSTLLNALLGEDRVVTGPEAGTTRDAVAVGWQHDGRDVVLVDTAGQRRRARVEERLEQMAVADALRTVRSAHVVALVLDAQRPVERQDLAIARHVVEKGRALVIVANKWDAVADRAATHRLIDERLEDSLSQASGVAVVQLSAATGAGLDRLMPAVSRAFEVWNSRIPTARLNEWLAAATERHPPPLASNGRRIRLRYAVQARTRPPTFALFCNRPEDLVDSYLRYLENGLRADFDLPGTPIRLNLRRGDNPYRRG
ncbi:MAG: ribosome biogenesis GTPase Der [Alphaproteobacteria bacterium]|nr:ribosome biogenesis GTPase Der [Alphaproteobacteria bacterium]